MKSLIYAYLKFEVLSDELKAINNIRSKARLDCTLQYGIGPSEYLGMEAFRNKLGQIFLYKGRARNIVDTHYKRIADYTLTNNYNFSSIYVDDIERPEYGYGYPNGKEYLKGGQQNPLYFYRNDAYLFIINSDYSIIEVLIIQFGKHLINSYYQKLIDGDLDYEINWLRDMAQKNFQYEGLGL